MPDPLSPEQQRRIRDILERVERKLERDPPRQFGEAAHERYYEMGIEDALRAVRWELP